MSTLDSSKIIEVSSVNGLTDASSKGYADIVNPSSIGQSGNFLGISKANAVKWRKRDLDNFPNTPLNSITYGNDLYVMCGDTGVVGTSTDTVNWTLRTLGTNSYNSIAYYFENYYYVIAGTNQRISTDGISWSLGTSGFGSSAIRSITYNNGLYTAAGGGGTITSSTNLITWQYRTSGFGTSDILSLIYENGIYIAGGTRIFGISTDSITWQFRTSGFGTSIIYDLTYANGIYLAGGTGGTLATSTNAIYWSLSSTEGLSFPDRIQNLTYGNGLYVFGGYYTANNIIASYVISSSTDTVTWTFRTSEGLYIDNVRYLKFENNNFFAFPESEPRYVAVSSGDPIWFGNATDDSVKTSPKGFIEYRVPGTYTFDVSPDANNFYIEAIGAGGGGASSSSSSFVSGGGGGGGAYYANLINRKDLKDATTIGVTVGAKGLGGGNRIDSSTAWSISETSSVTSRKLYYLNDNYYLLSSPIELKVSTDAIVWSIRTLGNGAKCNNLVPSYFASCYSYNDGLYVYGGVSGVLGVSTDSINWELRTTGFIPTISSLVYGNNLYVAGPALGNTIMTSTDTITWTKRTLGFYSNFSGDTSVENELFIVTYPYTRVYSYSTDAISWQTRTFPTSSLGGITYNQSKSLYYDQGNYITYNRFSSILNSTDLIYWSSTEVPFPDDTFYISSFSYDTVNKNYLVVLDNDFEQIVQFSTDSINWTLRTCFGSSTYCDYFLNYGNNTYLLFVTPYLPNQPSSLFSSTDTITWTLRTLGHPLGSYEFNLVNRIDFHNQFYFLVGEKDTISVSTDTITWQFRTSGILSLSSLSTNGPLNYENGIYSYAQNSSSYLNNYITYSTDSIVWDKIEVPFTTGYVATSMLFKDGLYHMICKNADEGYNEFPIGCKKLISTDLINWQVSTNTLQLEIYQQHYNSIKKVGNEYFIAGKHDNISVDANILLSSTDFINWSARTTGKPDTDNGLTSFSYGNGLYVIGDFNNNDYDFCVSTDSINWKQKYIKEFWDTNEQASFLSFLNNNFVFGGEKGSLLLTTDTITWRYIPNSGGLSFSNSNYDRINYVNGQFIILTRNNNALTSTDGISFNTFGDLPLDGYFSSVVYNDGLYLANGGLGLNDIAASTDLINWTIRTTSGGTPYALVYGNGLYIYGGNSGVMGVSTDSITWESRNSGFGTTTIGYLYYDSINNLYFASGYAGIIAVSTDAITWSRRTTGVISYIGDIDYYNNLYLASGDSGPLISSTDTITWTVRTLPNSYRNNSLTYDNGIYVVVGLTNQSPSYPTAIYTSTDSITWSLRTAANIDLQLTSIVSNSNTFVACGENSSIQTSTNGIFWNYINELEVINDGSTNVLDGIYQNGQYIFANESSRGAIVKSTDTITWKPFKFTNSIDIYTYPAFINYSNNLYLYCNGDDDVAVSTDSINWELRTVGAIDPSSGDYFNSKIHYKNGSYIMSTKDSFILGSTDTITWELRTSGIDILAFEYSVPISILDDELSLKVIYNSAWGTPCKILTSTNGIFWSNYDVNYCRNFIPAANSIKKVNDDVYIGFSNYVSESHYDLSVSTDLITWSLRTLGVYVTKIYNSFEYKDDVNLKTATYGNGLYVVGGHVYSSPTKGYISTSTDTITWTTRTSAAALSGIGVDITSMSFGKNQYVAVTGDLNNNNALLYSTDAITWSIRTIISAGRYSDIIYADNTFVAANSAQIRRLKFPIEQSGTDGTASSLQIGSKNISIDFGDGAILGSTFTANGGSLPSFPFLVGVSGSDGFGGRIQNLYYDNYSVDTKESLGGGYGSIGQPSGFGGQNIIQYFYGKEYLISGGSSDGGDGESAVDTGVYYGSRGGGGGGSISSGSNVWSPRTSGFGVTAIIALTYANNLYLAGGSRTLTTSIDGISWTYRTSGFGSSTIYDFGYGNGFYLAGGSRTLTVSTDTIAWEFRTSGFGVNVIQSILYANSVYFAAGGVGILVTSTDTISWTYRTSGFASITINQLFYNEIVYTAVGNSGRLAVSTDSITWEFRTSGFGTSAINGITYNNNLYICVGERRVATSTDAITWISRTSGLGSITIYSVTSGNNLYVASAFGGFLITSSDGINWKNIYSGFGSSGIQRVVYAGERLEFVAAGTGGVISSASSLLPIWSQRTSGFGTTAIDTIIYGNNLYVSAGSRTLTTSTDTINWTLRTSGFGTTNIISSAYGNNAYVIIGGTSISSSTDAINWTYRTSGALSAITFVNYTNDRFITVSNQANISTSTDGITWAIRTSGRDTFASFYASTFGDGLYLAGGYDVIVVSTDTISWSIRTSGFGTTNILSLSYGNGVYIAAGRGATLATSTDTINWMLRTTGYDGTDIFSLLYSNGLHLAGSQTANGLFVVSTDAINWEYRVSGFGTSGIYALTTGNNLYLAAGSSGTITSSFSYGYRFAAGAGGNGIYGGGGGGGGLSVGDQDIITAGGDGGDGLVRITWW